MSNRAGAKSLTVCNRIGERKTPHERKIKEGLEPEYDRETINGYIENVNPAVFGVYDEVQNGEPAVYVVVK